MRHDLVNRIFTDCFQWVVNAKTLAVRFGGRMVWTARCFRKYFWGKDRWKIPCREEGGESTCGEDLLLGKDHPVGPGAMVNPSNRRVRRWEEDSGGDWMNDGNFPNDQDPFQSL